jgi:hypothetical protein
MSNRRFVPAITPPGAGPLYVIRGGDQAGAGSQIQNGVRRLPAQSRNGHTRGGVFYESGLSINVMYTVDDGGKRAVIKAEQ